ncbi:MAG: fructose-bisphosphatase class II family protein [Rubrobacter sp.]
MIGASAVGYASVTETVALAVARLEGSGEVEGAYSLASETFERELARSGISGRVAILRERKPVDGGEMKNLKNMPGLLSVGDVLSEEEEGEPVADLAVEPVEGLSLLAKGQEGSLVALAASPAGTMLRTPDMYMSKIIVGARAKGRIDLDAPVKENIRDIAEANGRKPSELTVAVLDRDRHEDLISEIRSTGARIHMLAEGDLTPAIAVGLRGSDLHAVIGIGGAPEGVLAAAAIKCLGGEMQARMWPTQRSQVERLRELGLKDPEKKLTLDDLVSGEDVVFCATGLTGGQTLQGVRYFRGGGRTHTIAMSSSPRMIRFMDTIHTLEPGAGSRGFQI